jgi:hypothetical protein
MRKIGNLFAIFAIFWLSACASKNHVANLKSDDHTLSASNSDQNETIAPVGKCETNDDCVLVNEGCCKCSSGGTRIALSKVDQKIYEANLEQKCKGIVCFQIVNTWDPSCTADAGAECRQGVCQLAEMKQ